MKKFDKDISDIFEPTYRDGEPSWAWDWGLALVMGGFILFFAGILSAIIL